MTFHSVASAWMTRTAIWGKLAATAVSSSFFHCSLTATTAVPAKTSAANPVPAELISPVWSPIAAGASRAPMRPRPAISSDDHATAVATPNAAIATAIARAAQSGTRSYRTFAARSVMYPPAIPVPTAASAET